MKYILNVTLGLGLIAAVPAFAQSNTNHNQGNTAAGQTSSSMNSTSQNGVAHKLQQDLQQSGFKNVRVMPESFLVRADDKDGHPVMMIVNPDSVTAVTQLPGHTGSMASNSSTQTPGSSGGQSGTSDSSGNSSAQK